MPSEGTKYTGARINKSQSNLFQECKNVKMFSLFSYKTPNASGQNCPSFYSHLLSQLINYFGRQKSGRILYKNEIYATIFRWFSVNRFGSPKLCKFCRRQQEIFVSYILCITYTRSIYRITTIGLKRVKQFC